MDKVDNKEVARLAFIASGILTALDTCVQKLRVGFPDGEAYMDARREIDRLRIETDDLTRDIDRYITPLTEPPPT